MYRKLPDSNDAVLGYEVRGRLTTEEVKAMHREIDGAIREHGGVRLLVDLEDMSVPEPAAVLEDLKLTPAYLTAVEKFAIVGDSRWHGALSRATSALAKGEARHFDRSDRAAAWVWVRD